LHFPFFKAFAVYDTVLKIAPDFYFSVIKSFQTLASHFIATPAAFIVNLLLRLLVLPLSMEKSVFKFTLKMTTVYESLFTLTGWVVFFELTCANTAVSVSKLSLAFFDAVAPLPAVHSAIAPPASTKPTHLPQEPIPCIVPATKFTDENSFPRLETLLVITFENVTICPLPNALALREPILEVTDVHFSRS